MNSTVPAIIPYTPPANYVPATPNYTPTPSFTLSELIDQKMKSYDLAGLKLVQQVQQQEIDELKSNKSKVEAESSSKIQKYQEEKDVLKLKINRIKKLLEEILAAEF